MREMDSPRVDATPMRFPFLFGGTFIEGTTSDNTLDRAAKFPFLFGGTFIEG